jgi:large subunit ribosomal protein L31
VKDEIHPKYYPSCKVFHNGQVVMTVGATVPEMHVEVWSGSHPFFTGKQTFVDSAGRVEKFQRKFQGNYFAQKDAPKKAAPKKGSNTADVLGKDKA